ncbi:Heavy metal-associated domain, HMA [Burkholderiales bacterium]
MITYPLEGLHCGACVKKLDAALRPFATDVSVSLAPMQVTLTEPRADFNALAQAVAAAGSYRLLPAGEQASKPGVATTRLEPPPSPSFLAVYRPLLLIVAFILGASVLVQVGLHGLAGVDAMETMRYFMAGFFLVFSFFKLLNVSAFATAYAQYDLLAARWLGWGHIYPYVELALGVAYLTNFNPVLTHWATIVVMSFSAVGVIQAVARRTQIQCACLGTVFNLPMSTVTIVEDVGMVLMAGLMLWLM